MKHLIIYILYLLTATSCGLAGDPEVIQEGDVDLQFAIQVPDAELVTAGLRSSYTDNSVRCIDLLIFNESNQFMQRIKVNALSGTGNTKTFNVRVRASSASRTFHIIANGRDANDADLVNFSSITANMLESTAIPQLKTNTLAAMTAPALPLVMWGRTTVVNITSSTAFGTINMLRTAAAVSVQCVSGNTSNGLNDFSLTGFTVLSSSNMGRVAPAAYTSPVTIPTTVSLITGSAYINYVNTSGTGVWSNAIGNTVPDLYVYERTNILDNTGLSVIVRGNYKGTDGYYKIWLKNSSGQVIHVVRNHRYLIQINRVYGVGYPTLQEAMNSQYSSNIFVDIIDNDNDITDMIADGKYELGVSSNAVTLSGNGSKTIGTVLNTNPTATLVGTSSVAWITGIAFTGSGNRMTLTATLADPTFTRTGYITVRAGSLTRTIAVTQNPYN